MECYIKQALQNEIAEFKNTGDSKTYLNYLSYLSINDSQDKELCLSIMEESLNSEQSSALKTFEKDFELLIETLIKRRNKYYPENSNEQNLQAFLNFFSSIDISIMNFDSMHIYFMESLHKITKEDFKTIEFI